MPVCAYFHIDRTTENCGTYVRCLLYSTGRFYCPDLGFNIQIVIDKTYKYHRNDTTIAVQIVC